MTLNNNLYHILGCRTLEKQALYTVGLLADCPIYRAHFPSQPITPGVCLVQMAVELLSCELGTPLELLRVKNVKFLSVVSPTASPRLTVTLSLPTADPEGEEIACSATIADGERVMTKISMVCQKKQSAYTD